MHGFGIPWKSRGAEDTDFKGEKEEEAPCLTTGGSFPEPLERPSEVVLRAQNSRSQQIFLREPGPWGSSQDWELTSGPPCSVDGSLWGPLFPLP